MPGVCISNSLATYATGGSYGALIMVNSDVRILSKNQINSMIPGPSLWRQDLLRLYPAKSNSGRLSSRIKATWPFMGNHKGMDVNIEHSEAANEDIVIFFFQLDLETQIQVYFFVTFLPAFLIMAILIMLSDILRELSIPIP